MTPLGTRRTKPTQVDWRLGRAAYEAGAHWREVLALVNAGAARPVGSRQAVDLAAVRYGWSEPATHAADRRALIPGSGATRVEPLTVRCQRCLALFASTIGAPKPCPECGAPSTLTGVRLVTR